VQRDYDEEQRIKKVKEGQEEWNRQNEIGMQNFIKKLGMQKQKEIEVSRQKFREEKEQKFTPQQQIEIDREFAKIPTDYLKSYNYTETKTVRVPHPKGLDTPYYEEREVPINLDHKRKAEVIEAYAIGFKPANESGLQPFYMPGMQPASTQVQAKPKQVIKPTYNKKIIPGF
jgi:hypothetical protein